MDKHVDGHTDRQRDKHRRWADGQTERQKDKSHKDMTYGQTNRHAERKKYRQSDRYMTDIQWDEETYIQNKTQNN